VGEQTHDPAEVPAPGLGGDIYRLALDNASDLICVLDADGVFRFVSASFERSAGHSRSDLVGQVALDFIHADDREAVREAFVSRLRDEPREHAVRFRFRHRDGRYLTFEGATARAQAEDGTVLVVASGRDVSDRLAAEQALRESELRYRLLAEGLPLVPYTADAGSGRFVYVGPQVEQLLGFTAAELLELDEKGLAANYTVHPEDQQRLWTWYQRALAGKTTRHDAIDFRVRHADGRWRWVRSRAHLVRGERGESLFLQGFLSDVDRQKQIELALAASERRHREIVQAAPYGIALLDLGGGVLEVNPALEQLLDLDREQILGRSCEAFTHPGDHARERPLLEAVAAGASESYAIEKRYLRPDGASVWAWLDVRLIRDESGRPWRLLALVEDISSRRATETRLQTMFDKVPLGVAITGENGFIYEANTSLARMLGYDDPRELAERTFPELSHPDDAGTTQEAMELWDRGATETEFEKRYLRKDGEPVWVRVKLARLDPDSYLSVALIEDLSERRRFEEQLRQAQRLEAIGLLAGGVAHDFNNLLLVIGTYADMMRHDADLPDRTRAEAGEIYAAYERGAALTRQLLAFSRRAQLQRRALDLNETISEIETLIRRLLGEDVALELDLDDGLLLVEGDPSQLGQVLMNLAVNARDAMPGGGTLRIATRNRRLDPRAAAGAKLEAGDYAELTVVDDGHGMDAETMQRIFDPFFTTKAQGRGTGLGLAMVHGIVGQSGGAIDVESSPGAGTTFRILLPTTREVEARPKQGPSAAATIEGTTVLLVEDDPAVRTMVATMLTAAGCELLEARDGAEAMELARCHGGTIDLLVTDIVMPGMRGTDLADTLTAIRPGLKVLYVSGYSSDGVAGRGPSAGEELLEKPFTSDQLLTRVATVLGGA
jgi:two-component system cell cycle sensor histidine kinase/response regulator CckA